MIRPLQTTDLEALLALDVATNPHPWNRQQWLDSLSQHRCLGLFADDMLLGFAVCMDLPDEAELLLIAVAPQRQGTGLGQHLFHRLCDQLRTENKQRLLLEVRASNLRAQHFYLAAGCNELGRRKGYYPTADGREDALLYARNLDRTQP